MLPPPEGPRGPLEQETLDYLRAAGLGSVAGLQWSVEGSIADFTAAEQSEATLRILGALVFAVVRLAREIDELGARLND